MTLAVGDFDEFFASVHGGATPFAWQRRLLASVLEEGRWPDRIVAPTGAGKTAVIDVHVFAVALMAAGAGPCVPRRLSLVVDRRALVDSQFDLARSIGRALREAPDTGILGEVRTSLASLRSSRQHGVVPLLVTMLRGGVPASRRWVDDPAAAAVICATPAMWGSRLLFRGYGTGRLARPREAGLLAYDSVIVVDEAHLAQQLVATARRIDALEAMASEPLSAPRLQVVEATATGAAMQGGRSVGVTEDDLGSGINGEEVLARRLLRPKPVSLVPCAEWPAGSPAARSAIARLMADQAEDLLDAHGRTVACIANTVAGALAVATDLRKRGRTVEILVGRMRPHDVIALRRRRPRLLTIDGDPDVDVVVATQTIEVGLDADFSAMVTELAAGSAIAQRAGRVNRLGRRDSTEVRVLVPQGEIGPKGAPPYRADELAAALDWVTRRASTDDGLAPFRISQDPPPPAVLRRLVLGRPEPWDARLLARTSDRLFAEPDLDIWLTDDLEPDTDVSVVVRAGLGRGAAEDLVLLRATPPRAAECSPASIGTLRELLDRDGRDGTPVRPLYRWRGDELDALVGTDDLRPGDVVITGDDAAWFTHGVVDRSGTERVVDVLEDDRDGEPFLLRIGAGMPVDAATRGRASEMLFEGLGSVLDEEPVDGRARRAAMVAVIEEASRRLGPGAAEAARARLARAASLLRGPLANTTVEVAPTSGDDGPAWVVIADQRRRLAEEEVRQTWSGGAVAVGLLEHQADVATRAREIAALLALGDGIGRVLREAGALHDEGKRDARFQRLLGASEADPGGAPDGEPLAKSGRRTPAEYRAAMASSGLPTGWRHEQLSAVVAHARALDGTGASPSLVTRLVGTSHGHGRSTFPHTTARLIGANQDLAASSAGLHDLGAWEAIVDATHKAHGFWGCAYLEAILRAADGQVSGEADERA
ncbi:MAG: type I-U CRISPR-associated helicase/endonuclease Cas3 [Chloroflexota bacterium]|nr:type I-U CRISPR-associated helicase/endonuclease Cas3 [Chloroflexota bacterium]